MFGADRSLDTNKQKMAKSLQNSRSTTKFNLAGDENLINELIDADDDSQEINAPVIVATLVSNEEFIRIPTDSVDVPIVEQLPSVSQGTNSMEDIDDIIDITDDENGTLPAKVSKLDSLGRGRSLDAIWDYFHADKKLPKTKVACNLCGEAVSRKVERLRVHFNKNCKGRAPVSGRMSVPGVKLSTPKVTRYADLVTKKNQDEFNVEIGKYIFASNLPFSHVENPAFIRLIKKLRPGCQTPSRKVVGTSILNKVYDEVSEQQANELFNKNVTLIQDGWKTRTSEPVISHSVTTGDKSYFLKATGTEENVKTAKYCANLLAETIREVRDLGANVVAVVTDNCSSMDKMRRIISKSFPDVYTYGCNTHLLNLVGKRLTPEDMLDSIRKVHTFFRGHDVAWALLKQKGASRPIMPHDIRWNAWVECLEYYIRFHTKLLEVSRVPEVKCTEEICVILNDGPFYSAVELAIKNMKPVQVSLDKLQKEDATVADAVAAWIKLKNSLDIQTAELEAYFQKQFDRGMQPVSVAAYMMHPFYRGNGLLPEQIEAGNKFLAAERPFLTIVASHLKQRSEDFFPQHMFSEDVLKRCGPKTWWKSFDPIGKIDSSTAQFASKLMGLPAGSADIERHFSILGNIMNVRRARLGIEKAARLCVIYKHLAGSNAPGDDGGDWDTMELDK